MRAPALSVAMSVYNGERFLAEAIESVLAQTFGDFEFLILDDGSRDGTRDIVAAYAARDPRIRPIVRENRGLIASLNQLLAEARAPLVARMDADDVCLRRRFERQVQFLGEHPDYGVLGSWTLEIDGDGNEWSDGGTPPSALPVTHEAFLASIDGQGPLLCHSAVMYRRDAVLAVGGYHAAFRHCEDLDLWLRLSSLTRIANLPEYLLRYRRYDEQVSNRHATEQQIGAAVARMAWRERQAGRPDPTAHIDRLPPIDDLDRLFGREGVAREVRATLVPTLRYSREALRDRGFDIIVRYLREGGRHDGMWRTVARLLRFGLPTRAARLATMLAFAR
uniref:glycosyltransferase n=1 Tax=Novosphingobium sp. ZN18A2 TaxID=3079861 RepID=UPI0030CB1C0C